MKKLIILTAFLLVAAFSCDNDEYEAPHGDFSSFTWASSEGSLTTDYEVSLNDFIGLLDVSKNTLSHSWSIPQGTSLLNKEFKNEVQDLTPFITATGPLNTSEEQINVLFNSPGIKEVILTNTFKDEVPNSTLVDGVWQISETFTIKVFDDVKPAFKVMKGDEEVLSISETDIPTTNAASWKEVIIEAGEELTFTDLTTVGVPDKRKWTFSGGKVETSTKESVVVPYFSLGTYPGGFLESIRSGNPSGEATKIIPLRIKVIPSTKPFVFSDRTFSADTEANTISFNVTGEIESLSPLEKDNFTVDVVNTAAGFDSAINVISATVDAADKTKIILTVDPIFNSDNSIKVTYNAGNIASVDTRVLESFTEQNVKLTFGESVIPTDFAGFELPNGNNKKALAADFFVGNNNVENNKNGDPAIYYMRTEEKATSGSASMRYTSPDGVNNDPRKSNGTLILQGTNFNNKGNIVYESGLYRISYMIYLETGNTMDSVTSSLFNAGPKTIIANYTWDISATPRGEWVEISQIIDIVDIVDYNARFDFKVITANNPNAGPGSGVQTLYIDDLKWVILNPRS